MCVITKRPAATTVCSLLRGDLDDLIQDVNFVHLQCACHQQMPAGFAIKDIMALHMAYILLQ